MIVYETIDDLEWTLSEEARGIAAEGSHEAKVFEAVRKAVDGLKISDLPGIVGKESAKVGQGKAFAAKWVKKDGNVLRTQVDSIRDTTQEQLREIQKTKKHPDSKVLSELKKRKLVTDKKVITFEVSKGPKYARELVKEDTDLTAEMLARYSRIVYRLWPLLTG